MWTFTKPGSVAWLLIFMTMAFIAPQSDAINCYECVPLIDDVDGQCTKTREVVCTEDVSCEKREGSPGSSSYKSKGCADGKFEDKCEKNPIDPWGKSETTCYCNTDLCNDDSNKSRSGESSGGPRSTQCLALTTSTWLGVFAMGLVLKQCGLV